MTPGQRIIAFDTETKGFDWWADQTAFIATTADARSEWVFDLSDDVARRKFVSQLKSADVIVAHNLSFDVHQVFATIGFDILDCHAELHDTDLMSRVAWPEGTWNEHGGFGLKNLAKVFIDPEADTEEQGIKEAAKQIGYKSIKKTGAYYDVWRAYPHIMEAYALKDARYTWDLYDLLRRDLDKPGNERLRSVYEDVERPVIPILIRAERTGTPIERKAVKKLHKTYLKQQKGLHDSLEKQLGEKALGGEGSEDALAEALQKQGVILTETTDSGKLSTSQPVLKKFASTHPVVTEYLEYRHVSKFLSTYVEPMLDRDVVHPSFRQIGAWTGRMSCMRPNMQNIPVRSGSEVREMFVAPEGYKLVVVDYDSIEMRVLAYYLGKEGTTYRQLILDGHDPHSYMGASLAQRGVEPWAAVGTSPEDFTKDGPNSKLRADAKHTLFAIVYGAGGCKLCENLGMDTGPPLTKGDWVVQQGYKLEGEPSCKQGGDLAKAVKASIPGYMSLMRRIRNKIEQHGYVTTLLGRKQAVDPEKSYVGMSALIQGTAADIMKMGVQAAAPIIENHGGRLLLIVHDELVTLVPEQQAEAAKAGIIHAMESAVDLNPPLVATGTIATNYGEAK